MKLEDLPTNVRDWFENQEEPILIIVNKPSKYVWTKHVEDDPKIIRDIAKTYSWLWRKNAIDRGKKAAKKRGEPVYEMTPGRVPNRIVKWLCDQTETFVIIRRAHISPLVWVIGGDHAMELYQAWMNIIKREAGFAPDGTRLAEAKKENE